MSSGSGVRTVGFFLEELLKCMQSGPGLVTSVLKPFMTAAEFKTARGRGARRCRESLSLSGQLARPIGRTAASAWAKTQLSEPRWQNHVNPWRQSLRQEEGQGGSWHS